MTPEQFKRKYSTKTYLGDGLYAHSDGFYIILRAPRIDGDHWVALEPPVFDALVAYKKTLIEDMQTLEYGEKE